MYSVLSTVAYAITPVIHDVVVIALSGNIDGNNTVYMTHVYLKASVCIQTRSINHLTITGVYTTTFNVNVVEVYKITSTQLFKNLF